MPHTARHLLKQKLYLVQVLQEDSFPSEPQRRPRYNDYIIPLGPSGDPPVQFEVMQGQQIDTPKELIDNRGAVFVSIHENGDLRGCIGTIY